MQNSWNIPPAPPSFPPCNGCRLFSNTAIVITLNGEGGGGGGGEEGGVWRGVEVGARGVRFGRRHGFFLWKTNEGWGMAICVPHTFGQNFRYAKWNNKSTNRSWVSLVYVPLFFGQKRDIPEISGGRLEISVDSLWSDFAWAVHVRARPAVSLWTPAQETATRRTWAPFTPKFKKYILQAF